MGIFRGNLSLLPECPLTGKDGVGGDDTSEDQGTKAAVHLWEGGLTLASQLKTPAPLLPFPQRRPILGKTLEH